MSSTDIRGRVIESGSPPFLPVVVDSATRTVLTNGRLDEVLRTLDLRPQVIAMQQNRRGELELTVGMCFDGNVHVRVKKSFEPAPTMFIDWGNSKHDHDLDRYHAALVEAFSDCLESAFRFTKNTPFKNVGKTP